MKFTKAARPVVMGQNGMVSSGHALASQRRTDHLFPGTAEVCYSASPTVADVAMAFSGNSHECA